MKSYFLRPGAWLCDNNGVASQGVLHEKALTSAGSGVVSDGTLRLDCVLTAS